jgi:hypothetical protein
VQRRPCETVSRELLSDKKSETISAHLRSPRKDGQNRRPELNRSVTLLACKIDVPAMITAAERDAHTDRVAAASDAERTAANRDPSATERPDEFIIDRASARHFAFGAGMHSCPGAHLAKMEMSMALLVLLETRENIQRAAPQEWEPDREGCALRRLDINIRKGNRCTDNRETQCAPQNLRHTTHGSTGKIRDTVFEPVTHGDPA